MDQDQPIELDQRRLVKTVIQLKQKMGRDPSLTDITGSGVDESLVKKAVHRGWLEKHQVSLGSGQVENRYRVKKDIFSLNL